MKIKKEIKKNKKIKKFNFKKIFQEQKFFIQKL